MRAELSRVAWDCGNFWTDLGASSVIAGILSSGIDGVLWLDLLENSGIGGILWPNLGSSSGIGNFMT